jgi:hypothetical protein
MVTCLSWTMTGTLRSPWVWPSISLSRSGSRVTS